MLRLALALLLGLTLSGCGYVHFGRLPAAGATPTGDAMATAYSNLLTEHKMLQQELAIARKEGDTLRNALDRGPGSASPELLAKLNETTRELATLRASYARLQAERSATPAGNGAKLSELEEKLAASLRNYTQLQEENTRLRTDIDRAHAENSTLTSQLKAAATENEQAQSTLAQLNLELLAQKEARARAEQANAALNTQLGAVLAARDAGASSPPPANAVNADATAAALSPLQLTKAPPADSSAIAELRTNPERLRAAANAPAPAAKPARTHVVQAGDTLEKLAAKYYGDAKRWTVIYSANNGLLRDGRPLKPGMELEIPED